MEIDFKDKKIVALVGNPNVGKSVVFALLTGKYVTVSNYPGTTVELMRGLSNFEKRKLVIVDTPGMNGLIPHSEDEKVARDILLKEDIKVILHVADTKNLERSLLLTLQLLELGLPFILDLNIYDEALERGIKIDSKKLAEILGIEVAETVATEKRGINRLVDFIGNPKVSNFNINYDEPVEVAISEIVQYLPSLPISKRSAALLILSGDEDFLIYLFQQGLSQEKKGELNRIVESVQSHYSQPLKFIIISQRHRLAHQITKEVVKTQPVIAKGVSEKIGRIMVSPVWGIPFAIFVLYLMYKFVGQFGAGTLVDFLEENVFGNLIIPLIKQLAIKTIPLKLVQDLLIGEYGLITMALTYAVAIILPIVGTFFLAFGVLEDTGYLPRLATVTNNFFKKIGLHGKAVLPLILGLGCDTMATLTTRILETKKERIIATLLLALAVPCSAQLGVILGMLSSVSVKATLLWLAIISLTIGLVGALADKIIPGRRSDFMLEIPPLRIPKFSNIFIKVMARIKWYLKEAVPLFFLGTFLLFVLDRLKLLYLLERVTSPVVVKFLGLPSKATEAFIIGFLRRDYGAAGLYILRREGLLNNLQVLVSVVAITLFVPCVAQFFVTIKERGLKVAILINIFVFSFAILIGGLVNLLFKFFGIII